MLTHIAGLPPDSALVRKRQNAPMGWDNTAEMTAMVVDAVNILTRLFYNANYEDQIKDPFPLMPRPYEVAAAVVEPVTASLGDFNTFLAEGD